MCNKVILAQLVREVASHFSWFKDHAELLKLENATLFQNEDDAESCDEDSDQIFEDAAINGALETAFWSLMFVAQMKTSPEETDQKARIEAIKKLILDEIGLQRKLRNERIAREKAAEKDENAENDTITLVKQD